MIPDFPPYALWLIAAALLAIAELLVPGVFLIWLGIAAALTGLLAPVLPVPVQFLAFALLAIGAVYAGRRWFVAHPILTEDPLLNEKIGRLLGRTVVVVQAIDRGEGRVQVGDSVWAARGPDAPGGAQVRIVGAAGSCLMVEPLPAGVTP